MDWTIQLKKTSKTKEKSGPTHMLFQICPYTHFKYKEANKLKEWEKNM